MPRYSTTSGRPLADVSSYFFKIKDMSQRYPKLCANVVKVEESENAATQRETWNVSIGDLQHLAYEIRYERNSESEIRYEILSGYGAGITGTINFKVHPEGTLIEGNIPILDVVDMLYIRDSDSKSKMLRYFIWQDAYNLEGKFPFFRNGQSCPVCKVGTLRSLPSSHDGTASGDQTFDEERFECDMYRERRANMIIGVTDGIRVG